jgi:hypothetical protein
MSKKRQRSISIRKKTFMKNIQKQHTQNLGAEKRKSSQNEENSLLSPMP